MSTDDRRRPGPGGAVGAARQASALLAASVAYDTSPEGTAVAMAGHPQPRRPHEIVLSTDEPVDRRARRFVEEPVRDLPGLSAVLVARREGRPLSR